MKKLALVLGHTPLTPGGPYTPGGMTEYAFHEPIMRMLVPRVGHVWATKTWKYTRQKTYAATVLPVIEEINDFAPNLIIEFHHNSVPRSHRRWASGGCLHWGNLDTGARAYNPISFSTAGRNWGHRLADGALPRVGVKSWGSRPMDRSWNGPGKRRHADGTPLPDGPPLYILTHTISPAVIFETHNGRNPTQHKDLIARRTELTDAIAQVLLMDHETRE